MIQTLTSPVSVAPVIVDVSEYDQIIDKAHATIKAIVGDRTRVNNIENDEKVSKNGLAAEIAVIKLISDTIGYNKQVMHSIIIKWYKALKFDGENYGSDLPVSWTSLSKDVEVKTTPTPLTGGTGILFMRCRSGEARLARSLNYAYNTQYWCDVLPDSYYVLMHQLPKGK